MHDDTDSLERAFDPEAFRDRGHRLVELLADYLGQAQRRELPVLPAVSPDELLAAVPGEFPAGPSEDLIASLERVVARSNHLHHPGYVGHQVATVMPDAALADLTNALLNNGMAVYEMGQLQTVMERQVVRFLATRLGLPASAGGVLTHGGSAGNLTALLAARQAMAGYDVWGEGQRQPMSVLVSDQAHYCIARATQIMGWGAAGAIAVPSDSEFRMRADACAVRLREARAQGRQVVAVVASACTTPTGTFDPIDELADLCADEGLWLHVDGAHGASLALSDTHAGRLTGSERADSVVWDLHKLALLPGLVTAVLFRDERRSHEAFAQEASYLFGDADPEHDWFDVGRRTLECTKRGLGVTAYTALRAHGTRLFGAHVDRLIELAQELAAQVRARADAFELAIAPDCNIVCFRPRGGGDLGALRRRIIASGDFYLVQTRLRGEAWLRTTLMNPLTTAADLSALLDAVVAQA